MARLIDVLLRRNKKSITICNKVDSSIEIKMIATKINGKKMELNNRNHIHSVVVGKRPIEVIYHISPLFQNRERADRVVKNIERVTIKSIGEI